MRERPILFSAPMVRALLGGRKTQTRRIMKPQIRVVREWEWYWDAPRKGFGSAGANVRPQDGIGLSHFCPYGQPGDRLWVRETLRRAPDLWTYAADGAEVGWPGRHDLAGKNRDTIVSIHMPRVASRITLEITEVRVQRLDEISEEDATEEGSKEPSLVPIIGACWSERDAYAKLWEHINGPGSWEANPFVWTVSFKRVEKERQEAY
jgi:hypothetical protein